jgi:hypothetical protein
VRSGRLRSDADYGEALGIDDPQFVARTQLALAEFYAGMHDLPALREALRAVERSAPSPGFVSESLQHVRSGEILRVLEEVDTRAGLSRKRRRGSTGSVPASRRRRSEPRRPSARSRPRRRPAAPDRDVAVPSDWPIGHMPHAFPRVSPLAPKSTQYDPL